MLVPCKEVVAHLFDLIKNPVTGRIESDGAIEFLERSLNKKIQKSTQDTEASLNSQNEKNDKEYTELMKNLSEADKREGFSGIDLEGFEKYIVSRCTIKKDNSKKDVAIFKQFKHYGIKKDLKYFSDEEIT